MSEHVDIAIIGAGPGGYSAALRAAQLGKSVALVDADESLGGTCLNRGCIPSKALITATRTIKQVQQAQRMGVQASVQSIDFGALRDYRLSMVHDMTHGLASLLTMRGVIVYQGQAALSAQREVTITPSQGQTVVWRGFPSGDSNDTGGQPGKADGNNQSHNAETRENLGGSVSLEAAEVVLATGARPLPLPGVEFNQAILDSTGALELDEFPSSAVIIGAGPVAVEFACLWAQAGTKVTMLIRKDRVLSSWTRRTGVTLTRELAALGVNVLTRTSMDRIETGSNLGITAHYHLTGGDDSSQNQPARDGGDHTAAADIALVAIGRKSNTDAPWFTQAGVTLDESGYVQTDAWGRTSLEHVWAVGDITSGPALAYRAFAQGIVVAESIAGLKPDPVDDRSVPDVVFSTPEAASVGLTLEAAKARDDLSNVQETPFPMLSNARMLMDDANGALSVVTGTEQGHGDAPIVLGVHIVAPDTSAIIAEAQQLVGNRIELHRAASLIHPHPTLSEALGEALLKADGRPLHTR